MAFNPGSPASLRRHENLALIFQEILVGSERLRSGRQTVADPAVFRSQVIDALKLADQQARKQGYNAEDIKLAIFAVVAFVDESVLNLRLPVFADWPRRPLQEELFGHHIAGEIFFKNLQELLGKSDSQDLADLLEVYLICLLLGFAGRYSLGDRGELRSFTNAAEEKIRRIRGGTAMLSPAWELPPEAPQKPGADALVKKIAMVTAAFFALALILFIAYKLTLGSGLSSLNELTGRL
ncbi:MAG: DotU family type IV/VI secretion system protein [Acidobacteria bacterium]|nr:DotU family type IV/VI secretion system protein [Acidobacteriota bacterium]